MPRFTTSDFEVTAPVNSLGQVNTGLITNVGQQRAIEMFREINPDAEITNIKLIRNADGESGGRSVQFEIDFIENVLPPLDQEKEFTITTTPQKKQKIDLPILAILGSLILFG